MLFLVTFSWNRIISGHLRMDLIMPGAASALNWVVEVVWKLMCKVNKKDNEKQ